MKKEHPFKIPEDYFENLSDRVNRRIEAEENSEKKRIFQKLIPYVWIAASIVGIILITTLMLKTPSTPSDKTQQFAHLDSSISDISKTPEKPEDSNLFLNEISDVTTDELIEYLSEFDIETELLLINF